MAAVLRAAAHGSSGSRAAPVNLVRSLAWRCSVACVRTVAATPPAAHTQSHAAWQSTSPRSSVPTSWHRRPATSPTAVASAPHAWPTRTQRRGTMRTVSTTCVCHCSKSCTSVAAPWRDRRLRAATWRHRALRKPDSNDCRRADAVWTTTTRAASTRSLVTVGDADISSVLRTAVVAAMRVALPSDTAVEAAARAAAVTRAKPKVPADYQCGTMLRLSKALKRPPAALAAEVAGELVRQGHPALAPEGGGGVEVALPGFINLSLSDTWVVERIADIALRGMPPPVAAAAVNTASPPRRQRVLVDFASPNMGKELHVGHMRSSVIGDTLCRVLEYQGHTVDRVSHVGDLGMPVCMVIAALLEENTPRDFLVQSSAAPSGSGSGSEDVTSWPPTRMLSDAELGHLVGLPSPGELSLMYEAAKRRVGADEAFAARAQHVLRTLQRCAPAAVPQWPARGATGSAVTVGEHVADEPESLAVVHTWRVLSEASRRGYQSLFRRLGVDVTDRGESSYAAALPTVVDGLLDAGVATSTRDAVGVFTGGGDADADGSKGEAGPPPFLIRKADGGFLYATVDVAALQSRLDGSLDALVYVVDASQSRHFEQLFEVGRRAGWLRDGGDDGGLDDDGHADVDGGGGVDAHVTHVAFGVVQGSDGRKLSSRDGTDMTLAALCDEGVRRSAAVTTQLLGKDSAEGRAGVDVAEVAEAIAYSAIRFHDLSHQRTSNYVFSFDRALAFKGNSAVYLMYATARLQALLRKAGVGVMAPVEAATDGGGVATGSREVLEAELAAALLPWRPLLAASRDEEDHGALNSHERELALAILGTPAAIALTTATLAPHHLAEHALSLAREFHSFYDACRVVEADGSVNPRRAALCAATDAALRRCMALLGVRSVDRM